MRRQVYIENGARKGKVESRTQRKLRSNQVWNNSQTFQ